MIIVWSSNVSGPYALMLPVVFYGISYFVDEISVLLQGLRAGLFGAAITLAVLGLLALACKVLVLACSVTVAPSQVLVVSSRCYTYADRTVLGVLPKGLGPGI